jgi:hypothetical protein
MTDSGVADVTRFLRSFGSGLRAELAGAVLAARVGRFGQHVESSIDEFGNASLKYENEKGKHIKSEC